VAKIYRIGILETIPAARNAANLDGLRKGLRDLGYVEGRNLVIEYRSADGRAEQFPDLASELVRLKVDLIVTRGTPATRAVQNATGTIPVVMATMGGPGAIVASFARPGGNITGVITFSTELTAKRVEILKQLVPGLSRVALLHNMGNPAVPLEWEEIKMAARSLGLEAELLDVRSQDDIGRAFELAVRQHVDGLVIGADGLTQMHQQTIIDLVDRNRLPAVYPAREFVEAGGLIAYAVNYPDLYFRFATFVDKIFKGAKPGDLPVEQPTKFELVINLKTAKALSLTIPPSLLARADEVIE
jgi:putative ABC transport system substrate-binding protein